MGSTSTARSRSRSGSTSTTRSMTTSNATGQLLCAKVLVLDEGTVVIAGRRMGCGVHSSRFSSRIRYIAASTKGVLLIEERGPRPQRGRGCRTGRRRASENDLVAGANRWRRGRRGGLDRKPPTPMWARPTPGSSPVRTGSGGLGVPEVAQFVSGLEHSPIGLERGCARSPPGL